MNAWHELIALVAMIVILKFYAWCQTRCWSSPRYQEDARRKSVKECEDNKHA